MAELVDAQDSGSCKRKLVGVQVPPFALILSVLGMVLISVTIFSCKSQQDKLLDQSIKNLQVAVDILSKNAGHTDAAVRALDKYIKAHEKELIRSHVKGMDIYKAMSTDQRKAFSAKAMKKSQPLKNRIDNLLKTFPHPEKIAVKLHQLL